MFFVVVLVSEGGERGVGSGGAFKDYQPDYL